MPQCVCGRAHDSGHLFQLREKAGIGKLLA